MLSLKSHIPQFYQVSSEAKRGSFVSRKLAKSTSPILLAAFFFLFLIYSSCHYFKKPIFFSSVGYDAFSVLRLPHPCGVCYQLASELCGLKKKKFLLTHSQSHSLRAPPHHHPAVFGSLTPPPARASPLTHLHPRPVHTILYSSLLSWEKAPPLTPHTPPCWWERKRRGRGVGAEGAQGGNFSTVSVKTERKSE